MNIKIREKYPHGGELFSMVLKLGSNLDHNFFKLTGKLKSDSQLPKKFVLCFNETPLKIMKIAFCFYV